MNTQCATRPSGYYSLIKILHRYIVLSFCFTIHIEKIVLMDCIKKNLLKTNSFVTLEFNF